MSLNDRVLKGGFRSGGVYLLSALSKPPRGSDSRNEILCSFEQPNLLKRMLQRLKDEEKKENKHE